MTAARLRIRATDGTWLLLRAAPLSPSAQLGDHAVAVTVEPASPGERRPLLMRAYRLTAREREVAGLVTAGLPTSQIAASLFITSNTVGDHLKAIFAKVGVRNRHQLTDMLSGHLRAEDVAGSKASSHCVVQTPHTRVVETTDCRPTSAAGILLGAT